MTGEVGTRTSDVQMDNLTGLLGIRRGYRVTSEEVREFYEVMKRVNEKIDGSVLRWFDHTARMGNDRYMVSVGIWVVE